jgi:hypothetical protein
MKIVLVHNFLKGAGGALIPHVAANRELNDAMPCVGIVAR